MLVKSFIKTKVQTNLMWFRTVLTPKYLNGISKLDATQEHFARLIFDSFFWKMFCGNILRVNFDKPWQITRPMQTEHARARKTSETSTIFWGRTFCFLQIKKIINLQIYSRIGKTMKKLQYIANTFVNTRALLIFWYL